MRNHVMLAAIGLSFAAMPLAVLAEDAAQPAVRDGTREVCKFRQRTGTRFKAKICKTAAEWDKVAEDSRRSAEEVINSPKSNPVSNPG